MKIKSLIEAFETTQTHKISNNAFKHKRPSPSGKTLGQGSYGRVFSKGNPHTLSKVPTRILSVDAADAYVNYIAYIVDNKLAQETPHFPRVYSIKTIKDGYDNWKYDIQIEKLHHMLSLTEEQYEAIMVNNFNINENNKIEILERPVGYICGVIRSYISGNIHNSPLTIKSESLLNACKILNKYYENLQNDIVLDIHSSNIMVRLTQNIPQLVILDPFS